MDLTPPADNTHDTPIPPPTTPPSTPPTTSVLDITTQTFQNALAPLGQAINQTLDQVGQNLEVLQTHALALGAAGITLTEALAQLPQTVETLAQEMPAIARRMRMAGLRPGDSPRSSADIMALFNKIPGTSKLGSSEAKIREFLANKDASHIKPHSQGGSNRADNILWEVSTYNRARGALTMTIGEQLYIRVGNAIESILQNSGAIARLGLTATGSAILTQVIVTAIAYSLDLYRGDITPEQYQNLIWTTAKQASITTPILVLILIAVLALIPELTLLLSAPAVIAGFNALFGLSIATPIIQSLLRHLNATESQPITSQADA